MRKAAQRAVTAAVVAVICSVPAAAQEQGRDYPFGRAIPERVTQDGRWVEVLVTYHNTTRKTFDYVEIQCTAHGAADQLLGENTWMHGDSDGRRRFPPDSRSVVKVLVNVHDARAASAKCRVAEGHEPRP